MKKYYFILGILLLFSENIFSQAMVSSPAGQKLYMGLDNVMTIMIHNHPCKEINVEVDRGELVNNGDCRFIYRPDSLGIVTFRVSTNKNKKNVFPFQFRTYNLPELDVRFGNNNGGDIEKKFFLKENKFNYWIADGIIICDVPTKIESFMLLILRDTSIVYLEKIPSDSLTQSAKENISNSKNGDKILFLSIIASINRNTYNLKPLEFTIRE